MNKHLITMVILFIIAGVTSTIALISDGCATAPAFIAGLCLMAGLYEMGFWVVDTFPASGNR